jgi:tetratricopeptide (TPR) repeat protein
MDFLKRLFGKGTPPLASHDAASDQFAAECFDYEYRSVPDSRTADDFPEWVEIDRLTRDGQYEAALAIIDHSLSRHPDSYVIHSRKGLTYKLMGNRGEELRACNDALERSSRKYYACDSLGQLAFEEGNDRDAVLWWVRACDMQLQTRELRYARSFACLAYISTGIGFDAEGVAWLWSCVERTPSPIDFTAEVAGEYMAVGTRAFQADYGKAFLAAFRELRRRAGV